MNKAVVTGAAGDIGAAIVAALARRPLKVFMLDNNADKLNECAARLASASARVEPVACDVSSAEQITRAFRAVEKDKGELAGLINCAAVTGHRAHFLELKEADWDRVLDVNLKGVMLASQAAALIMAPQRRGSIVNIGSVSSRRAHREQAAYDAAKGGLESLTRAMALDLAPCNIRVNAVLPAAITTQTMVQHPPEEFAAKMRLVPLGRYGRPEEVAAICAMLVAAGEFVTGQCIIVDGGLDAQLRSVDQEYTESRHFQTSRTHS